MKVLWVINKPLPEVSQKLGLKVELSQSWLLDLARVIREANIELCTACVENVNTMLETYAEGANHYVIPMASKFTHEKIYGRYWKIIMEKEVPDMIHLHGTEYKHPIALVKDYKNVPTLLTIQGVMTRISEQYYGELPLWKILKYRTWRENIHFGGMLFTKRQYKKQAKIEQQIIKNIQHVTGRTLWDESIIENINPDIIYYQCNYNLRAEFYTAKKWDIKAIKRYSIYTSFSSYPLKGLHILLKAAAIVKKNYPNVMINVPGIKGDKNGHIIANTGYTKYISDLILELNLQDNVFFLGGQKTEEVINNLQNAHICIVASAIEGASATLREGMHIGTPCICSYRGGMTELLTDRINGFYYDFDEYAYLAKRIIQIFENDDLAKSFSEKVIQKADELHDRKKNAETILRIYSRVMGREGE